MDRRSGLLLFSDDQGRAAAPEAARLMAELLGWSEERRTAELEGYLAIARAHQPHVPHGV
jgi:glycerol-3-phosphate dehydrogenase